MYVPGAAATLAPRDGRAFADRPDVDDNVALSVPSRAADGNAAQFNNPPTAVDAATTASARPSKDSCPRYDMGNCGRRERVPGGRIVRWTGRGGRPCDVDTRVRCHSSDERTEPGATNPRLRRFSGSGLFRSCQSRKAAIGLTRVALRAGPYD